MQGKGNGGGEGGVNGTPKEGDGRKLERGNERLEGGELGNDTNKGTKINKFLCE